MLYYNCGIMEGFMENANIVHLDYMELEKFSPDSNRFRLGNIYISKGGKCYAYIKDDYFFKIGTIMVGEVSRGPVSYDGKLRLSSDSLENLIKYVYFNNFDKDFIVRIKDISKLEYIVHSGSRWSQFAKRVLAYWRDYYITGNSHYVYRVVSPYVYGGLYEIEGFDSDFVYLGYQCVSVRSRHSINYKHLFVSCSESFCGISEIDLPKFLEEHGGIAILNPEESMVAMKQGSTKFKRLYKVDNTNILLLDKKVVMKVEKSNSEDEEVGSRDNSGKNTKQSHGGMNNEM